MSAEAMGQAIIADPRESKERQSPGMQSSSSVSSSPAPLARQSAVTYMNPAISQLGHRTMESVVVTTTASPDDYGSVRGCVEGIR